jgi:predicted amidohydrolase
MHDIVIRGGAIIDGTGKAAFTGDVAIAGDRIAAVGGKLGPARREIDRQGFWSPPAGSTCTRTMMAKQCGTRCWRPHAGTA